MCFEFHYILPTFKFILEQKCVWVFTYIYIYFFKVYSIYNECSISLFLMCVNLYIAEYRAWWVNCHLNYTKMKISLIFHFIRYIYQNYMKYLEILEIKFIQRNCHWLEPQPPYDFGISCKPFQWFPYLNWKMLPLSLPLVPLWCCTEICWSLAQPCLWHVNQGDCNLGS